MSILDWFLSVIVLSGLVAVAFYCIKDLTQEAREMWESVRLGFQDANDGRIIRSLERDLVNTSRRMDKVASR